MRLTFKPKKQLADPDTYKRCAECGERKKLSEYHKQSGRSADGYRAICKCCRRIMEANRQRIKRGNA